MKITIIKKERNEKRYARVELDEFVSHLREGDYRPITVREPLREVCFAAGWQKSNGELKVKEVNNLVLLSLENLRDLATVQEYKRLATQQPYTMLCFLGHDGHSLRIVCPYTITEASNGQCSIFIKRFPQAPLHLLLAVGHTTCRDGTRLLELLHDQLRSAPLL